MDLIDRAKRFRDELKERHPHITFVLSDYKTKEDFLDFNCARHGKFNSSPRYVFRNIYGCDLCYKELKQHPPKNIITPTLTTAQFIENSTKIHKGFYTYENTVYETRLKPVTVTCPLHGDFVISEAWRHTVLRRGCLDCKREASMLTKEEFVEKCSIRTKHFYDYSNTVYDGLNKDISVLCNRHGVFTLKASHHLKGRGCPVCKEAKMDLYNEINRRRR